MLGTAHLAFEPVEATVQEGQCPATLKKALGRDFMGRLEDVAALGVAKVDREMLHPAAALGGAVPVPGVGEEVLERGEQERAEPAPRAVDRSERPPCQQVREERLGQVLGARANARNAAQRRRGGTK